MLAVIGDLVQDIVVRQLEPVRAATDTAAQIRVGRGGAAANTAAFAGPRHPTRFIGCVGNDLTGSTLRTELERLGVDVRLQVRDDVATGVIVVVVDETGERVMFPDRGASAMLAPVDSAWLDVDLLHISAYTFETSAEAAAAAATTVRATGGKVCVDVASVGMIDALGNDRFLEQLVACRPAYVSANADECARLEFANGNQPGPGLERLGDAVLIARDGQMPTHVYVSGALVATVDVPPVLNVVDLTGAGDAFNAGFLTHVLGAGFDPVASTEAGHALSARVIGCVGAREPSRD